MTRFFLGFDLGKQSDFAALSAIERHIDDDLDDLPFDAVRARLAAIQSRRVSNLHPLHLVGLERFPLGTTYPELVRRVARYYKAPPFRDQTELVVDATGVGAPVIDMFKEIGIKPFELTSTGGEHPAGDGKVWSVPKRDLVMQLLILYQRKLLLPAVGLRELPLLEKELLNFKMKVDPQTKHDAYEAAKASLHDDLVMCVAVAAWRATRLRRTGQAPDAFVLTR